MHHILAFSLLGGVWLLIIGQAFVKRAVFFAFALAAGGRCRVTGRFG
jgi:hypothetical protein